MFIFLLHYSDNFLGPIIETNLTLLLAMTMMKVKFWKIQLLNVLLRK